MRRSLAVVSGATGLVGRAVVDRLLAEGHEVCAIGRRPPPAGLFDHPVAFSPAGLEPDRDFAATFRGADCFIHCALDHLPGRFRGGEGDDPQRFRRRNLDGTLALFGAARSAGVKRVVFMSSRAVYGDQKPGAALDEDTPPRPASLYGEVKLAGEAGLAALCDPGGMQGVSLRATGVYGTPPPGRPHKWAALVDDHLAGRPVPSRAGTEVHAEDLAWAVLIALTMPMALAHEVLCVSDIVVDNAEILSLVDTEAGRAASLPARADAARLNVMDSSRLRSLGWPPGGQALFEDCVRTLARERLASQ